MDWLDELACWRAFLKYVEPITRTWGLFTAIGKLSRNNRLPSRLTKQEKEAVTPELSMRNVKVARAFERQ